MHNQTDNKFKHWICSRLEISYWTKKNSDAGELLYSMSM